MEEEIEMEEDSSSTVVIHATRGTFIQARQTVRLLKLGIPRIVSALVSVTSVSCTSQQKK